MTTVIVGLVCLIVGGFAGLLIGRKNPKVADEAVKLSSKVK